MYYLCCKDELHCPKNKIKLSSPLYIHLVGPQTLQFLITSKNIKSTPYKLIYNYKCHIKINEDKPKEVPKLNN